MSLECTMAEVPCLVIRDGVLMPRSTFESEMIRLRSRDFDGADCAEYADYIVKHWGRICWHCDKRITLVYPLDPVFGKPDGEDEKQYLHRSCWDRLKLAASYTRRRTLKAARLVLLRAVLKASTAAAGPVGGLGYEPQPMLAFEGPRPMLALEGPPPVLALPAPPPPSPAPTVPDQEPDQEPDLRSSETSKRRL